MFGTKWNAFFNPEQFQGWGKKRQYFEGWYFKIINAKEDKAFAFIPGIAFDEQGIGHAFIQVLDGKKCSSEYITFPVEDFKPNTHHFDLMIANNHFSEAGISLGLENIKGHLRFKGNVGWPKPWYSPGIMGPFAFIPFMQCYHGIVSMDHSIKGALEVNGTSISFDNGRGYLEKDWGTSFPSAYIWMQSNHFSETGISFKASIANIPFMGTSFVGFIAGIWLHNKLIRFTTYNRCKLRRSFANQEKVEIVLEHPQYRLEIFAKRPAATALASPIQGAMNGKIEESMTANLEINLIDKKTGQSIFQDVGRNAGLEVAGKIEEIMV